MISHLAKSINSKLMASSILKTMEEQQLIPAERLQAFFWNVFIADALLGNFDRHNGNWGLLIDESRQKAEIAPVYDCGSCLYPQLNDEMMEEILKNETEINQRIFVLPRSVIMEDSKKISYFDFISSLQNQECNEALERISGRIDLEKINHLIEETPAISQVRKDFYQMMIAERKRKIIDYSMGLLRNRKKNE